MKAVIFDSGTLITLSMDCTLDILRQLKTKFNGKFIITKEVQEEIVVHPMNIKKYKLGAIRLKSLIDDKILEFPESLGVSDKEISDLTSKLLRETNSIFNIGNKPVHIIDYGEASILGLSKILRQKGVDHLIAIDERTTRLLCEKPDNLKNILEQKFHKKIRPGNIEKDFRDMKFIRSSELVYVAFKKGIIKNQSKDMLDALLYSTKFNGASISSEEIKILERS